MEKCTAEVASVVCKDVRDVKILTETAIHVEGRQTCVMGGVPASKFQTYSTSSKSAHLKCRVNTNVERCTLPSKGLDDAKLRRSLPPFLHMGKHAGAMGIEL